MKIALKYKFILGLGTFILLLQMWLNSGNMSVYAATLSNPHTMKGYITNYDDVHYYMNYKMICGAPSEEWKVGYTLRRVGLFVIGYPFFRLFGFYWGGEITSFLLVLFSFIYLVHFVKPGHDDIAENTNWKNCILCKWRTDPIHDTGIAAPE